MRSPWVFFAIWLCCIRGLYAIDCDFGDALGPLNNNALTGCHVDIEYIGSTSAACPVRVDGNDYVWHPQVFGDGYVDLYAIASDKGNFYPVPPSDVVVTEALGSLLNLESNGSQSLLRLNFPTQEPYIITERRLIFICGPRNLVLTDELQRHLDDLSGARVVEVPWTSETPLTQEIKKIGAGLGVLFFYRGDTHMPLQGCGSRPSPLFAPDNEVTVDPITGTRSCVADPMSETPIGFLCEGRIEPADCMRSLVDENGEVVKPPRPHSYRKFDNIPPWRVARYFNDLALPMFTGECRCIGSDTGELMARIEIRPQTEYVCDISSLIERNNANPINGPWCSVVLHPGSTLTIRFPTADVHSASNDATQLLPTDQFEAEFLPKDLTTLRQLKTAYDFDVYEEISYNEALAGDALEMDVSQMAQGEVKLKYHADKPLALKGGHNSFLYHWRLKSTNGDVPDKLRAIVKLSLALTHPYHIIGGDRGPQSLFDPKLNKRYCSTKSMGNDIGDVYECINDMLWVGGQTGIYCKPDEELLPNNCGSSGYDIHSNQIVSFPAAIRGAIPYPIRGFQVLEIGIGKRPLSYACICVDERGYEKSKLVLASNHNEKHTYLVRREERSHMFAPQLLLPLSEFRVLNEVPTLTNLIMIPHMSKNYITLKVGTTLIMSCSLDAELQNVENNGEIEITWLPMKPEEFYYTINQTPDGSELVKVTYDDSLATSRSGLKIKYEECDKRPGYHKLKLTSRRSAILISKYTERKQHVPMTFVCGKTPRLSDFSTNDNATANGESSALYTWHVLHVNVQTTDPYMQGCGVTYASDELFKPETPPLYDAEGQSQFGCKIDLQAAKEAAFYCPAPYVLDPPNCFSHVYVDGVVKNMRELSKSLVSSRSNHFVILRLYSSLIGPGETLRQAPPLECRCITVKGAILSTIQIENYYSK
ncbi:hypothetical protein, conserved [Babesia ovata]|uniref:6-Cys domain-containing protein n=1 Tax=Babesia ovata TaxID=189622 RepID=A0A2H6KFD7_9APIC|nr:uncharacterized protein BOVATA_032010 [Babesia ovata]GBE61708.1 hypothetical protein, conserved [Babesia ovata]